ncbi:MAG: XRE family transcriptional regulator [Burkholderiales bacterium]|nr:MAG: XRE family transcriptional regulator [Burkholderiales bacterium]
MSTAATAWIGDQRRAPVTTQWVQPPVVPQPARTARPAVNEEAVSGLVGKNLRRLRKQHRLSLEELARQSGVSRAMLGQVEQGKSIPSIKTLWQVAQAFGVSVSWFLESGSDAHVLLITPAPDSPVVLRQGEGELRSLQQVGDSVRDAFYELRLAPGAVISLPASTCARRINVVVSSGTLLAEVDDAAHVVREREALQYEANETLIWRNATHDEVQAYVVIRAAARVG